MGNIPFPVYISLAFLEGLSVLYFLYISLKVNWSKKELLFLSGIYSILTLLLRKLPISFGIHSLVLICVVSGFFTYYYRAKLSSALFGMILVFGIAFIVELSSAYLISETASFEDITTLMDPFWWFISGLPHIVVLFLLSKLILKLRG